MAFGQQRQHGSEQGGEEHAEQGNFAQKMIAGDLYPAIEAAIHAGHSPQQIAAQFGAQYLQCNLLKRMTIQQLLTANGHFDHCQALATKGLPGM